MDFVGQADEIPTNAESQEHNADGLGNPPIHGGRYLPFQGNGSRGLQGLPRISVQNHDLAGHTQFFSFNVLDESPTVREAVLHVEEPDATPTDPQRTGVGHHDAVSEADVNINRAPFKGHGLPELFGSVASRDPSEKSYITDLGARGREIATSAGQLELTTAVVEKEEGLKLPLEERLLNILQKIPGHSEKKGFFPEQTLRALINECSVKEKLQSCFKGVLDRNTIERHTQTICGTTEMGHKTSSRKIFAILVLSQKVSAINLLINEKVTDKDLPLRKVSRGGKSSSRFSLVRKSDPEEIMEPLKCFETWSWLDLINFEEWQWTTMAPFFHHGQRKNVENFVLQDQVPLPFTADSRYADEGSASTNDRLEVASGFSTVFKADIHPQHHGFRNKFTGQSFAVKLLTSRNREEFNHEAEMLMKFSDDSHEYLISLLARYQQFKKFYLIFPWAEADLEKYWKTIKPCPVADYDTVRWVAQQCWGIADGLFKIHRYESISYDDSRLNPEHNQAQQGHRSQSKTGPRGQMLGRHGDMKPQNLLWFPNPHDSSDRGTLKITDFGLTEISISQTLVYSPRSILTPSYRPPEFDLLGESGRSHDIWALGCIYLDFIAWLLGGWDFVQEFALKRRSSDPMWSDIPTDTFFEIVRCKRDDCIAVMVKQAVSKFINDLHAHSHCTEYLHDFLSLIQMRILTIKPPMCSRQDRGRIEIGEVVRKLEGMLQRCKNDPVYASKPAPWTDQKMMEADRRKMEEAFEVDMSDEVAGVLRHKRLTNYEGRVQKKPV
ncbi:hypothetical protein VPNG_04584 [Cytospora leucostoma]|uniref:Protein kinase domain-containing protein n=1 Tax=Cytospora leucostoma TaxID=1230097 RepID=A0A423XCI0_9PEZI|nr:hypothetical protein VPNG_04584 [Cytospora leucostoma]